MSQWNNSYTYNNQYQDPNTWNGELNEQYANQNTNYYPNRQYDQGSQYVSFDQFLSQIQTNGAAQPGSATYNNSQYPHYSSNQFNNYTGVPSTSQNSPQVEAYNYGSNSSANMSNGLDVYQAAVQNQYNAVSADPSDYSHDVAFTSNLTATATEFVPKSTLKPSSSNTNNKQPETFSSYNPRNSRNHASDSNWRDRPSSSSQSNDQSFQNSSNNRKLNSNKNQDVNYDTQESNPKNNDSSLRNYDSSYRNQDSQRNNEPSSRNYDSNSRNHDSNSRSHDSNSRNHDSNSRNPDSNPRNYEQSSRNQDSNYRNNERSSTYESNHRSHETGSKTYESRNQDSGSRNQDSGSRNQDSGNRNQDSGNRNQAKSISKSRNKDSYSGGTFYNSTVSKNSQDVRYGKGDGGPLNRNRNWTGSSRIRGERNTTDDEQFANNYHQYKEERAERLGKVQGASSPMRNKNRFVAGDQAVNTEMTQRERLSEQLDKGALECLVCCERVKQTDTVWSCGNCYHVLHLRCIRKWAMSSLLEGKWRCPACQNRCDMVPTEYRCMCGAVRNPEWQRGAGGAHTCGRSCKRARSCPHPCTLLCHPGPCPPCQATVSKQCGCGAETRSVLCSSKLAQVCGAVCRRKLNCAVHECGKDCHEGPCDHCTETVTQVCHCPAAKSQSVPCTADTATRATWSCSDTCGRVLSCGAHVCRAQCHAPPCEPCAMAPERVHVCPCGKTRLEKGKRKSCTDPIPLCGNICAKPLPCGPVGDKHFCKLECHEDKCPACPDKTLVQCRCGHSSREVPCADLPDMVNNIFCQKKCSKKLSCGRHRCRELCCAAETHRCPATCGRTLSCQLHRCEEFCHTGHCAPCPRVSFTELSCECGAQTLLPPVRCGAKPPACSADCRRPRPCAHPPHHSCHSGDCPPCVVLTTKKCYGLHEERKTIPCSQEEFSCGLPCGKPLPCGKHTCIKICHKGLCDTAKCTQPCLEKRPNCGHPCGAPCHFGAGEGASVCPSPSPCRKPVKATCPCGRRSSERSCHENAQVHNRMLSALAAAKMQEGGSVDLSELSRPGSNLKTLECDDECRVEQRTRQMALALQIRNPDVSAKLAPRYSEHVRTWAQRDSAFARHVHDKLTELVQLAKKSKQKTRSHSFPSMNWQKRQFIHELCEHFGCESVAYDAEPNRNVVATADKEKSWLPAMSVLEVLGREAGKRRVPGPVLRPATAAAAAAAPSAPSSNSAAKSGTGWATLTSTKTTNAWAARAQAKQASEPKIDYFDNPPE